MTVLLLACPAGAALRVGAPSAPRPFRLLDASADRRSRAEAGGSGVSAEIQDLITKSGADVAVAFRTLDGRDELFIQPDVAYHAASTMKLPVLIELFRQARAGGLALGDQIPVVNQFHSIVDGSPFTLDTGDDSDAEVYKDRRDHEDSARRGDRVRRASVRAGRPRPRLAGCEAGIGPRS